MVARKLRLFPLRDGRGRGGSQHLLGAGQQGEEEEILNDAQHGCDDAHRARNGSGDGIQALEDHYQHAGGND